MKKSKISIHDTYQGKTMADWAQSLGMSSTAFRFRIEKYGWDEAIRMGPKRNYPKVYQGKNITEWAAELGIAQSTMTQRVQRMGWAEAVKHDGPQPTHTFTKKGL